MHSGVLDLFPRVRGDPLLALGLGLTTLGYALPAQGVGLTAPKLGSAARCAWVADDQRTWVAMPPKRRPLATVMVSGRNSVAASAADRCARGPQPHRATHSSPHPAGRGGICP